MILSWETPERVESVEDWKKISADGAPPGVYTPNMSKEDQLKWKAKLTGHKAKPPHPQVEIRKNLGSQVLIIVSLGGFKYQHDTVEGTKDYNVRISMNGPSYLTFQETEEMLEVVKEAKAMLKVVKRKIEKKELFTGKDLVQCLTDTVEE